MLICDNFYPKTNDRGQNCYKEKFEGEGLRQQSVINAIIKKIFVIKSKLR